MLLLHFFHSQPGQMNYGKESTFSEKTHSKKYASASDDFMLQMNWLSHKFQFSPKYEDSASAGEKKSTGRSLAKRSRDEFITASHCGDYDEYGRVSKKYRPPLLHLANNKLPNIKQFCDK